MASRRKAVAKPKGNLGTLAVLLVLLVLLAVGLFEGVLYVMHRGEATAAQMANGDGVSEGGIVFGGLPQAEEPVTVLRNKAYIVGYSETRRDPLWVAYRVIHMDKPNALPRPGGKFLTDERTAAKVTHDDYTDSGFDRGHMAPNSAIARCFGEQAQHETFLMSNICPQAPSLNRDVWEKLERDEMTFADKPDSGGTVYVMDGPIFDEQPKTLKSGVAVPRAFYKILVERTAAGGVRTLSVIMPQGVKGTELPQQFLTPIAEIERQAHVQFFGELDPATRAELKVATPAMW